MRLNMTKEEYDNELKNENSVAAKYLYIALACSGTIGLISGYFSNGSITEALSGLLIGVVSTLIFGGMFIGFMHANQPPKPPYCIYEHFESLNEKVLSIENLGTSGFKGRYKVYRASNYYLVQTTDNKYMTEVEMDKVISNTVKEQ